MVRSLQRLGTLMLIGPWERLQIKAATYLRSSMPIIAVSQLTLGKIRPRALSHDTTDCHRDAKCVPESEYMYTPHVCTDPQFTSAHAPYEATLYWYSTNT